MRKISVWKLWLLLVCLPAYAQMGSPGGGETQALALHPTNPQIIYVGAAKGLGGPIRTDQRQRPSMNHAAQQPGQKSHDAILWFEPDRALYLSGGDGMPDRGGQVNPPRFRRRSPIRNR